MGGAEDCDQRPYSAEQIWAGTIEETAKRNYWVEEGPDAAALWGPIGHKSFDLYVSERRDRKIRGGENKAF